jgi:hypothetical protein
MGSVPLLYAWPAGKTSINSAAARRVSLSELLGGELSHGTSIQVHETDDF